ncbi:MAG: MerR family transcriptional regulator [Gordonia sp. (in: high G+C Gram-positive bacteria)]
MTDDTSLSIAEMSAHTGLSTDTLRWYEREGILPPVTRDSAGRRRYGARDRDVVTLLVGLRDSGMPTTTMRAFVELLAEGAASHGRRIALLEQTRERLAERRRQLDRTTAALEAKIGHYETLIAAGLDCHGAPVDDDVRPLQAAQA